MLLVTHALFLLSYIKIELTFTWIFIKVTAIKMTANDILGHGIFSSLSFNSDLKTFVI